MKALLFLWTMVSSAVALADTLEIKPAVELIFPAAPDKGFQLEVSSDLFQWQPLDSSVVGISGPVHRVASANETNRFFRIAVHEVRNLDSLLEPIRQANKVPAVACAVIISNRIVALGAVGQRRTGVPTVPVTLQDKWHHGSLTKSMTATLAAILVEEGKIKWETTLAEVFPDFAAKMLPQWRTVTLDWLCSNRSGAPEDLAAIGIWGQIQNVPGTPRDARHLLLELLTVKTPKSTPGTKYEYSNAGFALAGHMLETVSNLDWEELLTLRLFEPLGMHSAGFGVPATPRYVNQPWGHQIANGNPIAIEPGPSADNPPSIGPAATVHCNLMDLARFVAFHLSGHKSGSPLITRDTFLKLHTALPNNGNYAYGWVVVDRPWAGGAAMSHAGSNTTWYSVIWMAPNVEFGVVALCNLATASGANPGLTATDQIAAKMIQTFLTN